MTKEKLKQEAEKWVANEIGEQDLRCIRAYIDSAEPREKRIEELIALINAERERQEKCDDVHLRTITDLEKENAELKKENQKWKDGIALKDEEIGCIETDFNTFKSKAKEIIKTFLGFAETFGYSPSMDRFITEAEQFLSEVEK